MLVKQRLRTVINGAALSLGTLCACGQHDGAANAASQQPDTRAVDVRTAIASRQTIHPTLLVPGAIAPSEIVALSNSINEPAQAVNVVEGDRVGRGTVLAQLQVDDLQANLRSALLTARSNEARTSSTDYSARLTFAQAPDQVRQARAQAAQADETLREAQTNLTRDEQLAREGYLPAQNVEEQQVVVRNDEQGVGSARAALRIAIANQVQNGTPERGLQAANIAESADTAAAEYATAEQLRREIARATIVSPIDGIVINRNLNPGEYPAGRQIFTLEATDNVFAILTASAVQAYQIHPGNRVLVTRPGLGNRRFLGTVTTVLDAATPGSTNFTVKVNVPNPKRDLRAGTPVQAIVDLGGFSGPAVPSSAFSAETRTRVIAVREGRARSVPVEELATDGATSIVSGLAPGTAVVRDGGQGLADGSPVRTVR